MCRHLVEEEAGVEPLAHQSTVQIGERREARSRSSPFLDLVGELCETQHSDRFRHLPPSAKFTTGIEIETLARCRAPARAS
jgi:hypothetical protein